MGPVEVFGPPAVKLRQALRECRFDEGVLAGSKVAHPEPVVWGRV